MTVNYKDVVSSDLLKSHNVKEEFYDLTVNERKEICMDKSFPYAVGIINVTGELNTGSIIRSANLLGAKKVFIFGRKNIDRRGAVGAYNYVDIEYINCMKNELEVDFQVVNSTLVEQGLTPVVFEHGGQKLSTYVWDINYPCILVGNEGRGMSNNEIQQLTNVIQLEIPQVGVMRSFNVSNAATLGMYDFCTKKGYL